MIRIQNLCQIVQIVFSRYTDRFLIKNQTVLVHILSWILFLLAETFFFIAEVCCTRGWLGGRCYFHVYLLLLILGISNNIAQEIAWYNVALYKNVFLLFLLLWRLFSALSFWFTWCVLQFINPLCDFSQIFSFFINLHFELSNRILHSGQSLFFHLGFLCFSF